MLKNLYRRIESQLLEVDDIDTAIINARVLVLLFKAESLQGTSWSMVVDMTNTFVDVIQNIDYNK